MQKKRLKGGVSMENKVISDCFEEKRHVCNLYAVTASGRTFLECYNFSFRNCGYSSDESAYDDNDSIFVAENWDIFNADEFHPFRLNCVDTLDEYLRNPEKDSAIKALVDKVGVTEKILRFFLRYETFTTDRFGECIAENPWYLVVND